MKDGYVAVLVSLDTKAEEADFICQVVRDQGGEPLLIDMGVLGRPRTRADVSRHEVAEAAGTTIEAVIAARDQARALIVMADGVAHILGELLKQGWLGGVLSVGGSRGTALGTRVMQSLPVGIPKLMISTMAAGQTPFEPYVGTRDVTITYSVADILGVNAVTRPILTNAAVAMAAMARVAAPLQVESDVVLAATMLGVTTPLVEQIRSRVQTGGRAMEELVDDGVLHGVFDVSLSEIACWLVGTPFSPGIRRLEAAGRRGIPQVIVPGGVDLFIEGVPESIPECYSGRITLRHTPTITLVRTSADEGRRLARYIATHLAEATGPVAVVLPLAGFSRFSLPGEPLFDPEADAAFIDALVTLLPALQVDPVGDGREQRASGRGGRPVDERDAGLGGKAEMQVQVQLFSILRDCLPPDARHGSIAVAVPDKATLNDLVVQLGIDRYLGLDAAAIVADAGWQITVNRRFELDVERVFQEGDRVHMFPPVAGG